MRKYPGLSVVNNRRHPELSCKADASTRVVRGESSKRKNGLCCKLFKTKELNKWSALVDDFRTFQVSEIFCGSRSRALSRRGARGEGNQTGDKFVSPQ